MMGTLIAEINFLKNQKNTVSSQITKELRKGDIWYVLDINWFRRWKHYVGYDCLADVTTSSVGQPTSHPGHIDNRPLLKPNSSGELKDNLIEGIDYQLVPSEIWDLLYSRYGLAPGQQSIRRRVTEHGKFVKTLKVEVYLVNLKLARYEAPGDYVLKAFSRTDKVEYVLNTAKSVLNIGYGKRVRLWVRYWSNDFEALTDMNCTVQDAGLYQGPTVVLETQNSNGSWPRGNLIPPHDKVSSSQDAKINYQQMGLHTRDRNWSGNQSNKMENSNRVPWTVKGYDYERNSKENDYIRVDDGLSNREMRRMPWGMNQSGCNDTAGVWDRNNSYKKMSSQEEETKYFQERNVYPINSNYSNSWKIKGTQDERKRDMSHWPNEKEEADYSNSWKINETRDDVKEDVSHRPNDKQEAGYPNSWKIKETRDEIRRETSHWPMDQKEAGYPNSWKIKETRDETKEDVSQWPMDKQEVGGIEGRSQEVSKKRVVFADEMLYSKQQYDNIEETLSEETFKNTKTIPKIEVTEDFIENKSTLIVDGNSDQTKEFIDQKQSSQNDPKRKMDLEPPNNCNKHPDFPIEAFCVPCKMEICSRCKFSNHDTHPSEPIESALQDYLPALSEKINKLCQIMEVMKVGCTEIQHKKQKVSGDKSEIHSLLLKQKQSLEKKLNREYEKLAAEIESKSKSCEEELDRQETAIQGWIQDVHNFMSTSKPSVEIHNQEAGRGSAGLLRSVRSSDSECDKILKECQDVPLGVPVQFPDFSFDKSKLKTPLLGQFIPQKTEKKLKEK